MLMDDSMKNFNYYHDKLYELVRSVGRLESSMKNIDSKLDKLISDTNKVMDGYEERISSLESKYNEFDGAIKTIKFEISLLTVIFGLIAFLSHVHFHP